MFRLEMYLLYAFFGMVLVGSVLLPFVVVAGYPD